jgi:hypothetical protein
VSPFEKEQQFCHAMLYIRMSLIPDAHVQYVGKYLVVLFVL